MEYLPFWNFFKRAESELGYSTSMDSYLSIMKVMTEDDHLSDFSEIDLFQFYKFFLLQKSTDEDKLRNLLKEAIETEYEFLFRFQKNVDDKVVTAKLNSPLSNTIDNQERTDEVQSPLPPPIENAALFPEPFEDYDEDEIENNQKEKKFFQLPDFDKFNDNLKSASEGKEQDNDQTKVMVKFLLTDEYFSVTRRQMVKAWKTLRSPEKNKTGTAMLDVEATIKSIAKEGVFTEAKYISNYLNRKDSLIILADYKGSMAPFHELTERLINAAKGAGGHPMASVYYFHNYPMGYLFKKQNLTNPITLKEALVKTNPKLTVAIIISDAGAAISENPPERTKVRLEMTSPFLEELTKSVLKTVWLNPLPQHRWKENAAEEIVQSKVLMTPIIDDNQGHFQNVFQTIFKEN
ncbi:hypothetical protein [Dyadobacter sp. 32]|uniref:hypothetical protein n=1 Tax=Dyadobacter sp. 32 TaxID=538966 RepID=UPI0011F00DC5